MFYVYVLHVRSTLLKLSVVNSALSDVFGAELQNTTQFLENIGFTIYEQNPEKSLWVCQNLKKLGSGSLTQSKLHTKMIICNSAAGQRTQRTSSWIYF